MSDNRDCRAGVPHSTARPSASGGAVIPPDRDYPDVSSPNYPAGAANEGAPAGAFARPVWPQERLTALRQLWAEGLTTAAIAQRLGLTKNAVIGKAHRLGLPGRASPIRGGLEIWDALTNERVRELHAEGCKPTAIANYIGCSRSSATNQIKRLGLDPWVPPPTLPRLRSLRAAAPPIAPPVVVRAERAAHPCRWPLNDARPWRFCEGPARAGSPYCAAHHKRAFI